MEKFINQFGSQITGVLHGIDRIMIKGYISEFYHNNNFFYFLSQEQVQLKDYKAYVLKITAGIKESIEGVIKQTGCHYEYLRNSEKSKAKVSVEGYTDSLESDEYNMKLSEKRAGFVYNYLVKKGIPKERLFMSFYGKTNPVNDNKTAETEG